MNKIHVVDLTPKQRKHLRRIVRVGSNKAQVIMRAHILLKSHGGLTDKEIADFLYTSEETVRRTRVRFREAGLALALSGRPQPPREPTLTDEQEAYLVALACSDPPAGRTSWTIELLADRLVADGVVETIGREKVRLTLKKTNSSPG
ncbi:MAG: helix-turn-helix domain-containing protein [Ketobacter sp.]|nr:helix-turn-helix domain-containing protein [Ketobacter sp.]